MTKRLVVGAAAAVLFAVTGAAKAADVMPVVVSVTPAVPVVAAGPTITIEASAATWLYVEDLAYPYVDVDAWYEVNVTTANGWGFNLSGGAGANLVPGYGWGSDFRLELYRIMGNAQVGFFVNPYDFFPINLDFGPTFRYKTSVVDFRHETQISYFGDWVVEFVNDITLHPNERLEVGGYFDFEFGFYGLDIDVGLNAALDVNDRLKLEAWGWADLVGMPSAGLGAEVELKLGALTPYVGTEFYFGGGPIETEIYAGIDFERQIGTGPFTLFGGAGVGYDVGDGIDAYARIGIRFNRGDVDNLLFHED